MPEKWSRDEIRQAFAVWLANASGRDWPEASDPDALADYLVGLLKEEAKK